jgi:hypothetical protein
MQDLEASKNEIYINKIEALADLKESLKKI